MQRALLHNNASHFARWKGQVNTCSCIASRVYYYYRVLYIISTVHLWMYTWALHFFSHSFIIHINKRNINVVDKTGKIIKRQVNKWFQNWMSRFMMIMKRRQQLSTILYILYINSVKYNILYLTVKILFIYSMLYYFAYFSNMGNCLLCLKISTFLMWICHWYISVYTIRTK